jgi:hypothetical protein
MKIACRARSTSRRRWIAARNWMTATLRFLEEVKKDTPQVQSLVAKHPDYQSLVDKLASLYEHISRKGLENEQRK